MRAECAHCGVYVEFEVQEDGNYCPECGWIQPTAETIAKPPNGFRRIKWIAWAMIIMGLIGATTYIMLAMVIIGIGLLRRRNWAYSWACTFEQFQFGLSIFLMVVGIILFILTMLAINLEGSSLEFVMALIILRIDPVMLIILGILSGVFARVILNQLRKPDVQNMFQTQLG